MITRKQLEQIAKLKGLNLGNTEKDYLLDIALLSISKRTKNELIFKGGTCLYKFHNLNRFSEDLDFSAVKKINVDELIKKVVLDCEAFGIKTHLKKKREPFNSVLITLKLEGPLFTGTQHSHASLGIDINTKSEVLLRPELKTHNPIYQEIPEINVLCMNVEEIFAEKIRAIMTRKKARDLFDLHFLTTKNTKCNTELIQKKMNYYDLQFNIKDFINKIKELEQLWEKELKGFTTQLPKFNEVKKEIIKQLTLHCTKT